MSLTLSLSQCLPPLAAKLAENSFGSLILSDCRPGWTLGWFLLLRSSGRLLVSLLLFHLLLFLLLCYRGEKDRFLESVSGGSKWWEGRKGREEDALRRNWNWVRERERDVPVVFLLFFLSEKGAREKSVHFPCLSPLCPVLVSLFHLDKLIPRFLILDSAVFFFFYFVIFVAEMCRDEKRVDHSHFLNSLWGFLFPSLPFPSFQGHCRIAFDCHHFLFLLSPFSLIVINLQISLLFWVFFLLPTFPTSLVTECDGFVGDSVCLLCWLGKKVF